MTESRILRMIFDLYLENREITESPREKKREEAYAKLDRLIEDNPEAGQALIDFQEAAMWAAFYEGFSVATEIHTGRRVNYSE